MKKIIASSAAPAAIGPYSQAILADRTLYISGQIPVNPFDGSVPEGIVAQTRQSLNNVGAILKEAGLDFSNVVKTTVLLQDLGHFALMNEVYAEYFPSTKPARVCCQVAALPKGVLVEIDAIAVADTPSD
ncbi:MAG: RidA family protein [Bacteroidales bacterium]|nr:RidA family protein [Bacteroidales bacterium]